MLTQVVYLGLQTFLILTNYLKKLLSSTTWIGLLWNLQTMKALTKVDNFYEDTKMFFLLQKAFHVVQNYVTQLPIHHYKSFHQLLHKQGHHRNIHCVTALFHHYVHWSISLAIWTFVRFSKLLLPLAWKRFCWFIKSFSFLSCVRIFYIFSFITHSRYCVFKMKICQFFNQFICGSSVTEFSKEQNKLSTSTVFHKCYCYRTFFRGFAVKVPSKIAVICHNYNHTWKHD